MPFELGQYQRINQFCPAFRKAFSVHPAYAFAAGSAVFDEQNLVSSAGLVPVLELDGRTGISRLSASPWTCRRHGRRLWPRRFSDDARALLEHRHCGALRPDIDQQVRPVRSPLGRPPTSCADLNPAACLRCAAPPT